MSKEEGLRSWSEYDYLAQHMNDRNKEWFDKKGQELKELSHDLDACRGLQSLRQVRQSVYNLELNLVHYLDGAETRYRDHRADEDDG